MDGVKKKISGRTVAELALGAVLILALVFFYAYSREARIRYAKGREAPSGQTVHFRLAEEDWAIADVTEYYSSLSYIPAERFALQQCGGIGDTVYHTAMVKYAGMTHVPLGLRVTSAAVLDSLPDRYQAAAEQQFAKETPQGVCSWAGAVYGADRTEPLTQEALEAVTQYLVVELVLFNPSGAEMFLGSDGLCVTAVDAQGCDRVSASSAFHSYSAMGRYALLEADQPVDYVGMGMNAEGKATHYRQPVRELAQMGDSFYVEEEMHLKLLYIVTNEELAGGGLALCSQKERGGEGQAYSNAGYAIRLQEETADDGQND